MSGRTYKAINAALRRRVLLLEYATMVWNAGEAVLTIALGTVAGSLALIGFGTVSVVELFASGVVVWHVRSDEAKLAGRTRLALRLISLAFVVLAIALVVAAGNDLLSGRRAEESPWGIAYLALTALVMFGLAAMKRRTATQLGSSPLQSEATVTFLDGILSVTTLAGLALNATLGWWWADPTAAILVALAAVNEARETWTEPLESLPVD
jgi:divalent metal cation (Fe/Co/Zn/Cd) transporter